MCHKVRNQVQQSCGHIVSADFFSALNEATRVASYTSRTTTVPIALPHLQGYFIRSTIKDPEQTLVHSTHTCRMASCT